jgi:pyruvate dehydrogenase E2 component (dihydrolipoamide acetyltransferase)
MPVAFIMPKFDMDQEKATIISWLKKEGDLIKMDESVLVVETEKVAIDVPAPAAGTLVGIRFKEGDVVPVTQVIAYVLKKGETLDDLPKDAVTPMLAAAVPAQALPASGIGQVVATHTATPIAMRMAKELGIDINQVPTSAERITREDVERFVQSRDQTRSVQDRVVSAATADGKIAATPAARRLAREAGISLESIFGSGPNGRIQAADVEAEPRAVVPASVSERPAVSASERPAQIVPLVGMRQKIAQRLQASFQESPHIALTVEADVTRLEAARSHLNTIAAREKAGKISLTALLVKVVAWALVRNPYINASLNDNQIYLWQDVNIGVATALEDGLIVPVIHKTSSLSIRQIADALADLSARAREGRLALSDVQRGTFTISNLGMFGIQQFRAVINPPESAILAVGAVVRKPVVVDEQDSVAVRPMMTMTIAADHRVIDGVVAARFLADLVQGIEFPETLLY